MSQSDLTGDPPAGSEKQPWKLVSLLYVRIAQLDTYECTILWWIGLVLFLVVQGISLAELSSLVSSDAAQLSDARTDRHSGIVGRPSGLSLVVHRGLSRTGGWNSTRYLQTALCTFEP